MEEEIAYRAGDIVAGKYRVDSVLGVGGFGAVLAATHMQLEEKVAIKILLPHAAKNPSAAERFLREARAAVRIRSEHVARVSDVGQLPDTTPYMVMEYLAGQDLSTVVKLRGGQAVADVAEWVLQACEAIAEAHSLGIIHRDLKPANLFLTHKVDGSPSVKVLDFGISKMSNETDKSMTKTSDVMGSPFYMSPEQMRSTRSVDARSDIWALGAIMFELLAGTTPFDAETMTALVVNIMQEPPRDITAYRRDVPPQIRDVILKCLQKDANHRFSDVAELAQSIAPFAHQRSQGSLLRVMAISGKGHGAQSGGAPAVAPTMVGAPMLTGPGISGNMTGPGADATLGGGAPQSVLLREQAAMTPGGVHPHPMQFASSSQPNVVGVQPVQPTMIGTSLPAQSWGGTYAGKKQAPSRAPLFLGVGALLVAGLGAGGFFLFGQSGGKHASGKKHSDDSAEETPNKKDKDAASTSTATATADVNGGVTAPPSTPTVEPVATNNRPPGPGKPSVSATASASATSKPTVTEPPPPPPPTHTVPPPPPPPTNTVVKPKPSNDPLFGNPD